ncbi:hypothetical protein [Glacieibacterium frigidum]|uniref:Uncharacterized protein n=1 Tax=Glacieibacterium frigidum TaxID=2593303 RepID=A0A552UFK5_9SPHN|nr:hypothetical protein [Glacieibacterium frigidum]TRW17003.1 hypothetical protein FMM06_01980 [Glacieibacterium frigidum]
MSKTRYRVEDNTPAAMARRKAKAVLPVALLGLGVYALWQKRDEVGGWIEQLKSKLDGLNGGQAAPVEVIPDDYDYSRPSVFNSTAMAGPQGTTAGSAIDGGTMGTDLGTQGEGAV